MKSNPFLSIVIANYNYGRFLETAIESVLSQDCQDFELIIVDGGSTDNSVDIIKKYGEHIAWWVSEPDNGQSHAFNKGFSRSKGEFITWLNADDILLPGTITAVKNKLLANPSADYATGNVLFFYNDSLKIEKTVWGPNYLPYWLQGPGRISVVFGPTTFWRRKVYEKLGPIDESLHYTMDTEYWCRMMMAGHKQVRVNHFCWGFRKHENSKTSEFNGHSLSKDITKRIQDEHNYIYKKTGYHPTKMWRLLGILLRLLDGSVLMSQIYKYYLKGKCIKEELGIKYKI